MPPQPIQKAGAIILNAEKHDKVLLIYRAKQNNWSFPKGHVEPGENPEQAMVREIKEETGLVVTPLQELPDLNYEYADKTPISIKMFLVEVGEGAEITIEKEGDKVEWFSFKDAQHILSFENLKDYLKKLPISI